MKKKIRDKTYIKILLPMIILLAVIYIFQSGYKVGQELYQVVHK